MKGELKRWNLSPFSNATFCPSFNRQHKRFTVNPY
ncbi:hypothetical protein HNR46_000915 [Haloferula luteola]|uniref:Uncharacterized protein n=1 Tax=Haloferula luteola TaxID=595692 RepID=A0A840UX06_9BACT|nr:hypothetical protein [Haloferula luteola]